MKAISDFALRFTNPTGYLVQAKDYLIDKRQHEKNRRWMKLNWPEDKLNNALAQITYCDKETFMGIYSQYKLIRHPNIDPNNPTRNLKIEVESIANGNLTKIAKDQQIAQAVIRFIQEHPERRFTRKLMLNINRLQANSSKLEAEANLSVNSSTLLRSTMTVSKTST